MRLDTRGDPDTLPEVVQTAIYRVAQEALTNVTRHAGATVVELELEEDDGGAELRVRDDGGGFDPSVTRDTRRAERRAGPGGDGRARPPGRRRAGRALGPGGGTTITLRVPVIRVLIADDHGIVRSGLRMLIDRQLDMEVVAEADDGVAALESTQSHRPTWRCSTSRCRA